MTKKKTNILFLLIPKNSVDFLYDDFTVRQALEKMRERRYSTIPVIERKTGAYLHSLREGDFLYYLAETGYSFDELHQYPLSSVKPSRTIKPVGVNEEIQSLYDVIIDQNFVPVTDDQGVFIGIVTRKAVMATLFSGK